MQEAINEARKVYKSRYRRELEVLASMIKNELAAIEEEGNDFKNSPSVNTQH